MENLPPIPTPLAVRVREFRIRYVPILLFIPAIVCAIYLWKVVPAPSNVLAEVEPISAPVIATAAGELLNLNVARFQRVTKNQEIGSVSTVEPAVMAANLKVIEADLEVKRAELEVAQTRNEQIYERQRLEYLAQLVQLEINRVNMELAGIEFMRQSNLAASSSSIISSNYLDQVRYHYLSLRTTVDETEKLLHEKERVLPKLLSNNSNILEAIRFDIEAQKIKMQVSSSQILKAPFDGVVSVINHRPGERVVAGAPILVITALEGQRILAYYRQPILDAPKVGDTVIVRKQSFKHESASAKVLDVGTQLDTIDPVLLPATATVHVERALPFTVGIPPELNLSPGERVDVILKPR